MAFRILLVYVLISMVCISSMQSLPLSDDFLLENDLSSNLVNPSSSIIYPYYFIPLICQQQEQYPLKITRKLCSNYLQSDKQQRGKRVGWTISV